MQLKTQKLKITWQVVFFAMLGALIVMMPDSAFAQITGEANSTDSPADQAICLVTGFFDGNAARAIAGIGIVILGAGACLGKVRWETAMIVGVGVCLIFGFQVFLADFGWNGDECLV